MLEDIVLTKKQKGVILKVDPHTPPSTLLSALVQNLASFYWKGLVDRSFRPGDPLFSFQTKGKTAYYQGYEKNSFSVNKGVVNFGFIDVYPETAIKYVVNFSLQNGDSELHARAYYEFLTEPVPANTPPILYVGFHQRKKGFPFKLRRYDLHVDYPLIFLDDNIELRYTNWKSKMLKKPDTRSDLVQTLYELIENINPQWVTDPLTGKVDNSTRVIVVMDGKEYRSPLRKLEQQLKRTVIWKHL